MTSYHNPGRNLSLTTTCSPYKIDDLLPSIPCEIPLMCMTFSSTFHHDHIFHLSINMSLWISTYYSLQWIQILITLTKDSCTKIDFSLCFVMCDALTKMAATDHIFVWEWCDLTSNWPWRRLLHEKPFTRGGNYLFI